MQKEKNIEINKEVYSQIIKFINDDLKTLVLDGDWGIGKSFLLKKIIEDIDNKNVNIDNEKLKAIYITPNQLTNRSLEEVIENEILTKIYNENIEKSNNLFHKFGIWIKTHFSLNSAKRKSKVITGAAAKFFKLDTESLKNSINNNKLLKEKYDINNTLIIIDEFERKSKKIDTIHLLSDIFLLKENKNFEDIKIIISLNKKKLKKDKNFNFNLIIEMLNKFDNKEISNHISDILLKDNIKDEISNKIELLKLEKYIINNEDEDFYLFNEWLDKIVDQYIKFEKNSFLDKKKGELKTNIKTKIKLPNVYLEDLFNKYSDNNIRRFNHFYKYIKSLNEIIINNQKEFLINFENYKNLINIIIEDYHKQINLNNIEEILTLNDEVFEKIIEYSGIYMDKELNDFNVRNEIFQKGYVTNFMVWNQQETPFEYYKKIKLDFPKNNFIGKANSANSILKSCLNNIPYYFNYFNEEIDEKFIYKIIDERLNLLLSHNDKYYEEIIYIKELLENYTDLKEKAPVNVKTKIKESLPEGLFNNDKIIIEEEDKLKILQKIKDRCNYSIEDIIKNIEDLKEKLKNRDKLLIDLSDKEDFYYIFDKIYELQDSIEIVNLIRNFIKINELTIEYLISYNESNNKYGINVKEQIEKLYKFN